MMLICLWSFSPIHVKAQTIFQTSYSNGIYMCGNDIQLHDGCYYIGGTAKDAISSGFLLMKTDSYGHSVWTKDYRADIPIAGKRIIVQDDFTYLAGNCNPNTVSSRGFIAKITSGGSVLWSKTFGSVGACEFSDVVLIDDTTLVLTGSVTGIGAGEKDILVAAFDTAGTVIWSKTYGKPGNETGNSIIAQPDSGFYLTGNIDHNDPDGDIFILKLTLDGNALWCKTYNILQSGYSGQKVYGLIKNSDNQLVISGNTKVYQISPGNDIWNPLVIKTDLAGNMIYAKQYELNSGGGAAYQIIETEDGYFAFTGYMSMSFGLLVKTDQLGETSWSKVYGFAQTGTSYLNQTNALVRDGGSYVMTGFVDTQTDTALYLIKANYLGETGCQESVPTFQADPHPEIPVISNLTLDVTPFIPDITGLSVTNFTTGPSMDIFCETPSGFDQLSGEHGVYPNPVKDFLQINGFSESAAYRLTNCHGTLVGSGDQSRIDFRNSRPGIYFLTICDNATCQTYKIIKVQ